jgi:Cu2+-exporting ATPase
VRCTHCGLAVPAGLIVPGATRQFCCSGCAAAWRLLNDGGFAEFYRLRQAVDGGSGDSGDSSAAGRPAGEDPGTTAFDGAAFRAAWAKPLAGGDELIAWYLEGLHCPACVWLVEQLPRLLPGVRWARLDLGTAQLRVAYDPAHAGPGAQARLLARLGYRARPYRADAVSAALASEHRDLLIRVAVAVASAVGAMHLAATLTAGELTGDLDATWRPAFAWGAILIALPGCVWAAMPLHRGAVVALRTRRWSVDLAASLAIGLALGGSAALAWRGSLASYADAAAMFAALLLTARLAVVQARRQVARAAGGLAALLPLTALRLRDGSREEVAIQALAVGDEVVVAAGTVAPGDGTVIDGAAAIDVAVLTGEARPLAARTGSSVVAGATCRSGEVHVRLEAVGADTRLATILAAAVPAQRDGEGESQVESLLGWFAPAALLLAVGAGGLWTWYAGWGRGLEVAVAVVVAACPCALGLAAPLVHALAAAAAAGRGLLLRDPAVLARISAVREVVCDKTGTLTEGRGTVGFSPCTKDVPFDPTRAEARGPLAAAERSPHPASQALAAFLRSLGVVPSELSAWREEPGRGVVASTADGHEFALGGTALTGVDGGRDGRSRIGLRWDGALIASFDLTDPLRSEAQAMVTAWQDSGARVHLASGDHPAAVTAVARQLGIADAQGSMSPEAKAALVRRLRTSAGGVAAVGDGVNDAAMLAEADVAVGISGGLEAALDRCHAFCTRPAEAGPLALWALAAKARRRIRLLLWISAAYNLLAIGGAAAGLFGPLVCAIAMPLSSLTVIAFALRTYDRG